MDKKEAYEFWVKVNNACVNLNSCEECPYYITELNSCIWTHIGSLRVEKFITDFLAKEGHENSTSLENVGPIVIKATGPSHFDLQEPFFASGTLEAVGDGLSNVIPSSVTKHDNVNSPKHYCKGGLECIQVIKAQLTPEQYEGYLYGNVIKYMWRWQDKNGLEDLRKAAKYLDWLQQEVKK